MSRERANLFLYLCDLLSTFTLQHSFRSHFYILSSNVAIHVASLLGARDKHLRLGSCSLRSYFSRLFLFVGLTHSIAAFRFFRACLKLNNSNIFKYFIKHDLLQPILDLTVQESRRDNLLSATCQEFFEYMRSVGIIMKLVSFH